jgi:hypothetical protein
VEALLALSVVLGAPGLVAGALAAYFVSTTPTRRLAVLFSGTLLVIAFTFVWVFSGDPNTCHDCAEFYGGAYSIFTIMFLVGNTLGWLLGMMIGELLAGRRVKRQRPPRRPTASA